MPLASNLIAKRSDAGWNQFGVLGFQPVDYVRAKLADGVNQVLGVFFTNDTDAFIHRLAAQARAAFDVIGGFGPLLAERVS